MTMLIRKYRPGEESELWNLFFNTVRSVSIRDYTVEQVRQWAPDEIDEGQWRDRIERINPYVCVHDGVIVGYADLQKSGHIDHFYVHHQWQGKGVGKRLFAWIESEAKKRALTQLTADVSITARPFFESRGFAVVTSQKVRLGDVVLGNFKMTKRLDDG